MTPTDPKTPDPGWRFVVRQPTPEEMAKWLEDTDQIRMDENGRPYIVPVKDRKPTIPPF